MKRKETTPKVMNLLGNSFMLHLLVQYKLSGIVGKKGCRGFQLCRHSKHNRSPRQRPVVQHNDNDEVRPSKRPTVPLYLDELTEKCKFRDQVEGSNILPRQVFPEGLTAFCRTDVSNTLAQSCHCELCCGMHLTFKNT